MSAPRAIEKMTEGTRIRIEFQNPTRTPSQVRPVQADHQALGQASSVKVLGQDKICPSRISAIDLNEVISMTQSGVRKNSDASASTA